MANFAIKETPLDVSVKPQEDKREPQGTRGRCNTNYWPKKGKKRKDNFIDLLKLYLCVSFVIPCQETEKNGCNLGPPQGRSIYERIHRKNKNNKGKVHATEEPCLPKMQLGGGNGGGD